MNALPTFSAAVLADSAARHHGGNFATPIAAEAVSQPWTECPEARAILASFLTDQPERETHRQTYGRVRDEWHSYADRRAEQLAEIRTAALQAILDAEDQLTRDEFRAALSAQRSASTLPIVCFARF